MSFRSYLVKRRAAQNASGDFVRYARADRSMPDVKSWHQLETYLYAVGAAPAAIAAGKTVWNSYQASLGRSPPPRSFSAERR